MPRRLVSFTLIAFGLTWAITGVGAWAGVRAKAGLAYTLVAGACMLMPALAAIIQQRIIDKAPWAGLGLHFKRVGWKHLGLTAIIGIAIVPLAFAAIALLGDVAGVEVFGHVRITTEQLMIAFEGIMKSSGLDTSGALAGMQRMSAWGVLFLGLLGAVVAACTVNLPFMLGEELGWRGYLYQATAQWSGIRRVLFTGVLWGVWHAPLILMGHNYPDHPWSGILLMVVFCTLLAFLFDWSRMRVNAIWGPCILHGIINGSAGLFALFAYGGHSLVASPAGVAGFLSIALLVICVLLLDRRYARSLREAVPVAAPL